jgi:hypothetical protein
MAYTSSDLIAAIERRSFAPANQLTFTATDILAVADEEIQTHILPRILAVREEYYVTYTDQTVTQAQKLYPIPERAVGLIAREVKILESGGNYRDIPRIEPENVNTTNQGVPDSFYVERDDIALYPVPSATGETLRVWFFASPGQLIDPSDAAVISAIDTGTNTVSVSTIPADWTTGDTFDFISGKGGHHYRGIDYVSATVSGTDIIFSSLPDSLAVGDYIALQDQSPLVQMPPNFRAVLAQCAAARILTSQNQPGADDAEKKAREMLDAAVDLITPRVHGDDRVLLPSNWF